MANKITIYGLVSEVNQNNIKYVGITRRNPINRLNNHIYEAKKFPNKNKRTVWLTNESFKVKMIILDVVNEGDNIFFEKFWISLIKSWGFNLVNSNNGGGGLTKRDEKFSLWLSERSKGNTYNLGKKRSIESKNNMSKSKIGKPSPRKGCVISDETKKLQSLAKLGLKGNATGFKHSEETKNKKRKQIILTKLNGDKIKEFNSVGEVANYFSVSLPTISKVLNKENKKYKEFMFEIKIKNNG
jgi:group I intron endonuclease